jgi:ABC-type transporter Mla subunit MlaD
MIQDTIEQIEARLCDASALSVENRAELRALLAKLKAEVASLPETHREQAQSIAGFTAISTHEAIRLEKNPQLLRHALDGLNSSVAGLEESHPRLVKVVNSICVTLSNLGI